MVGEPVIATNSGVNLLIGNNPDANGGYTSKVASFEAESTLDEATRDQAAFRKATGYIVAHPATSLVNAAKKYAHFFSSESFLLVSQFAAESPDPSMSLAKRYASVPLLATVLVNGLYAIVLVGGWLGLLVSARNRLWYVTVSLLLSFLCIHLVTFAGSRFHFPLMPFFVLFAVQTMTNGKNIFGSLSKVQWALFVVGVSSLLSVWGVEAMIIARS